MVRTLKQMRAYMIASRGNFSAGSPMWYELANIAHVGSFKKISIIPASVARHITLNPRPDRKLKPCNIVQASEDKIEYHASE